MGKNADWLRNYIDKHSWVMVFLATIIGILFILTIIFLWSVYVQSETVGEGIKNVAGALELFCIPGCACLLLVTNSLLSSIDSKIK